MKTGHRCEMRVVWKLGIPALTKSDCEAIESDLASRFTSFPGECKIKVEAGSVIVSAAFMWGAGTIMTWLAKIGEGALTRLGERITDSLWPDQKKTSAQDNAAQAMTSSNNEIRDLERIVDAQIANVLGDHVSPEREASLEITRVVTFSEGTTTVTESRSFKTSDPTLISRFRRSLDEE